MAVFPFPVDCDCASARGAAPFDGSAGGQPDEARPPLEFSAAVHVVLARELEAAAVADAEHGERRGHVAHAIALAHRHVDDAGRDQEPAGGVYAERADVEALRIRV